MSEPASLLLQCPIAPSALDPFLAARAPRLGEWGDIGRLDVDFAPSELAELDLRSSTSAGGLLRQLRAGREHRADWLCAYDGAREVLTLGQVLFTAEWPGILVTLSVLRRIGAFLSGPGGDRGVILVHDLIGGRGTLAMAELFRGGSALVAPDRIPPDTGAFAGALLGPVRDAVRADGAGPLRDDLDLLMRRQAL